jgi:hypothetical protein
MEPASFDIPKVHGTSYGFFEKPKINVSVDKLHVCGVASASYCANDVPHPSFVFKIPFELPDKRVCNVEIVVDVNNNVKTSRTNTNIGSLKNFDMKFRNPQYAFHVGCDDYGCMYRSKLELTCTFSFDIELEKEKPKINDDRDDECVVCMDEKATMCNEKCKHNVMCVNCAIKYTDGGNFTCPKCRAEITKLYLETGKLVPEKKAAPKRKCKDDDDEDVDDKKVERNDVDKSSAKKSRVDAGNDDDDKK